MKWQPSGLGLCGCACALLTGCSVGPAYKRPDVALPAQWHESASGTGGSDASASVWPAADIASDQVAQFIVEFIASRTIEIVDVVGSRTGADLVPSIKEAFPGLKVVADHKATVVPGKPQLDEVLPR